MILKMHVSESVHISEHFILIDGIEVQLEGWMDIWNTKNCYHNQLQIY